MRRGEAISCPHGRRRWGRRPPFEAPLRVFAALPNLAALLVMLLYASGADEAHRLQPETVRTELHAAIVLGVAVWLVMRVLVWAWSRP